MLYLDSYQQLREVLLADDAVIPLEDLRIHRQEFRSKSNKLLPGEEDYCCEEHQEHFNLQHSFYTNIGHISNQIQIRDNDILENQVFSYHIFMPSSVEKAESAIFLLHGFNEKNWDKYLPWAQYLARHTGSAVILFPIAFHMNRTLSVWSDKRNMFRLSEERKKMFPDVVDSSLTNVAISMRLHSRPQRFIWSGLQTYYDIIRFVEECKSGLNSLISPTARFHFMSYSIGCLLAEILKLTNHNNYFSDSRLCLFCGGSVFNRLSPVSKYILDSEANIALYAYMIEHMKKHLDHDKQLKHYINGPHPEGLVFYSMLDYKEKLGYRESLFSQVSSQIMAITLKQDTIIPPYEIINTLQGAARDIPIPVTIYDFPFRYNHVSPFPATDKNKEVIDEKFKLVFRQFAAFINGE
ncbi:DUF6051 family protein [Gaoshiqia sp. Z1-71]|uniref:DUF6051 family protein n=1 Tax=Gaoshiqia hydrogeniformans TaxID=3290090 RepID=UPI003BF89ECC